MKQDSNEVDKVGGLFSRHVAVRAHTNPLLSLLDPGIDSTPGFGVGQFVLPAFVAKAFAKLVTSK